MNKTTCGLVVLGLGLTVGAGLFLGGCIVAERYWALFTIIPALLGLLCQYGMSTTSGEGYERGLIGFDAWVFILSTALASIIGLPVILWHCLDQVVLALVLYLLGAVVIVAVYIAALRLGHSDTY